ncbi:IS3 family transposase [Desulfurispirillum indicum]|uniref:IS3 family transposase n=1 Tax=Desulfurispirillum indicum TaxID=936456 RepID=UPI00059FBDF0
MEPGHKNLSIRMQCKLLGISHSTYYYQSRSSALEESDLEILKVVLRVLQDIPTFGYRKIAIQLNEEHDMAVSSKQVRRIMHKHGLRAIYPKPNLSRANKQHKKYPYLLRGLNIWLPNQVWATDITYLKLGAKTVYLTAIIDLFSRKVLSWRISNTMDTCFCLEALDEAIRRYGVPGIFNTDQGSQYSSEAFTQRLKSHGIRISMDGKGRALDNVYVERLWRSVKYENIYIKCYENMTELKEGVKRYFTFYNSRRFHQSLDYRTPDKMYMSVFRIKEEKLAA